MCEDRITLSLFERLATPSFQSIITAQGQRRPFVWHRYSLSSDSSRDATRRLLIGLDDSRDIARARETTRNFDQWYKPAKSRRCIILQISRSRSNNVFRKRISRHSHQQTHPNQQDSSNPSDPVESRRFSRIRQTRPNSTDSAHGFINIEPPFPTAHYSREPQPGSASVIECLCGLIRVRGVLSAWAQSPFYDCSVVVLCPPVDLLIYGHRPF